MRLALVTGACKRLGAAIAGRLADDGWTLALHGHSEATPEPTLATRLGEWRGFVADLADEEARQRLLPDVVEAFGRPPDLLVNSASLFGQDDAATVTRDSLDRHFAVNLAAPVLLATQLAAMVRDEGRAAVVNILDQRIRQPNRDQLSYTLSKQALAEATRTLAIALAPKVRANAVAPGLTIPTGEHGARQLERLAAMMPLGLLPDPADVADAVAWLADARATTGQTVFVDGGAHMVGFERDFLFLGRD